MQKNIEVIDLDGKLENGYEVRVQTVVSKFIRVYSIDVSERAEMIDVLEKVVRNIRHFDFYSLVPKGLTITLQDVIDSDEASDAIIKELKALCKVCDTESFIF